VKSAGKVTCPVPKTLRGAECDSFPTHDRTSSQKGLSKACISSLYPLVARVHIDRAHAVTVHDKTFCITFAIRNRAALFPVFRCQGLSVDREVGNQVALTAGNLLLSRQVAPVSPVFGPEEFAAETISGSVDDLQAVRASGKTPTDETSS
jgi:hypothetical protein